MGRKLSENIYVGDPKSQQGFKCVQTEPKPDCALSFVNASSAFSWLNNFLLWNPKVYKFTVA
jgi:hypothetical protein